VSADDGEFSDLDELLVRAQTVEPAHREQTLFSLGGRRYYENPVSDLLAFFLNPSDEHRLGDLFLGAMLRCAQAVGALPDGIEPELKGAPARETTTPTGKRIDLVLEGDDWVLAIENKVTAAAYNPFAEYEAYVAERYPDKAHRAYVVFGLFKTSPPSPWRFVSYRSFLDRVKERIGQFLLNEGGGGKWLMLARELLLHLEHLGGKGAMNKDAVDFVTNNYERIDRVVRLRDSFLDDLRDKLRRLAAAVAPEPSVGDQIWKDGDTQLRALRLRAARWRGSDVALIINPDGTTAARVYLALWPGELPGPDVKEQDTDRANAHFRVNAVVEARSEGARYLYYTFAVRATPTAALPDVETACRLLSEWYPGEMP
jgi:hypothetical protein